MDLFYAVKTGNLNLAKELLRDGSDPNELKDGVTPVHLAVGNDDPAIAANFTKLLLQFNGNPNVRAEDGLTPVHVAASWGIHETLELLLLNGGDPWIKDDDGLLASDHAASSPQCRELIRLYGDVLFCNDVDDQNQRSFTYTRLQNVGNESHLSNASSLSSNDKNSLSLNDSDPEISFSFLRLSDSNESSSESLTSNEIHDQCKRRVSFKQSTPELVEKQHKDLDTIEEAQSEFSFADDTLIPLEDGQGINVTSPDNLFIFNKVRSRDSRKTHILRECQIRDILGKGDEYSPELSQLDFKKCRISEIPRRISTSFCSASGDGPVPTRRSILKPPSESSSELIEYLYNENNSDVSFIETQHPPKYSVVHDLSVQDKSQLSSNNSTIIYDWKEFSEEESVTESAMQVIPPELERLTNVEIKEKLQTLGEEPGPITPTTRKVYLMLLRRLEDADSRQSAIKNDVQLGFKYEMLSTLQGKPLPDNMAELEMDMVQMFQQPDTRRKWREGTLKSSFNYILLDPRVSRNLPLRCTSLSSLEAFKNFVTAIFYIGKGKRARPYAHFYEALAEGNSDSKRKKHPSLKVKVIKDIWSSGLGVVSLHIFQNVIPVEAYTREACMVDALGLARLTNVKRGDYYGVASTWSAAQRRKMGVFLLHKGFKIFIIEGERQIRPTDIRIGQ